MAPRPTPGPGSRGVPRRADARRTHDHIVETATHMIAARRSVTMSSLARQAGLSRPTLYAHFHGVPQVVEAAVDRALATVESALDEATTSTAPARERLETVLRSRWRSLVEHAEAYRLATTELPPGRMESLHHRTRGPVEDLIAEGQRDGDFRVDLPAGWLAAVVDGLLHQAVEEVLASRLDQREAPELLSRTVLSALANAAGGDTRENCR